MKRSIVLGLATGASLAAARIVLAEPGALPGDRGRPGTGVMSAPPAGQAQGAAPNRRTPHPAPTPTLEVALVAAEAIAAACKQYPLGIAIVDSEGVAKLIYVPDGSETWHGYSAVRKAYTAVTFKVPTSQLVAKAREDVELGAKVKADPNLQAFSGGLPLMVGDTLVGAIGVSGAEPGGHDEECGLKGLDAIKGQLK